MLAPPTVEEELLQKNDDSSQVRRRYVQMQEPVYDEISNHIFATYRNACILWIEEIINPTLESCYQSYKASIETPNEKRLFHGTLDKVAKTISVDGFDPTLNKTSAHGKGVYFSVRAEYSRQYCRRSQGNDLACLLICDVVTGRVCQGRANKPIPNEYNSATNSLKNPDMYIVNKREAAMPRYIVVFHPEAK